GTRRRGSSPAASRACPQMPVEHRQPRGRLQVDDVAALDHPPRLPPCYDLRFDLFVRIVGHRSSWPDEIAARVKGELLVAEAGRRIVDAELLDCLRPEAGLLEALAPCRARRCFTGLERSGRHLPHPPPDHVPVLP